MMTGTQSVSRGVGAGERFSEMRCMVGINRPEIFRFH